MKKCDKCTITIIAIIFTHYFTIFSRYSGSLSTGLVFNGNKSDMLLKGGVQEWYSLKNNVKQHITCISSKVHFEALQVAKCLYHLE